MASEIATSVQRLEDLCTTYETHRKNLTTAIRNKGVDVPDDTDLKDLVNKYLPRIVVGEPMRKWKFTIENVPSNVSNFKVFNHKFAFSHRSTDYKGDTHCGEYFTKEFSRRGTTVTIPMNFYDLGLKENDIFYVICTNQSQCYIDNNVTRIEGKGTKCYVDYMFFQGGKASINCGWQLDYNRFEDLVIH